MANPFPVISRSALGGVLATRALVGMGLAVLLSGCGGPKSLAALCQDLKHAHADVRKDALRELEVRVEAGNDVKEAIPFLTEVLQDSEDNNRYRAAKVLSKIGADSSAVPALALALKDANPKTRYYAAKSLSGIVKRNRAGYQNLPPR